MSALTDYVNQKNSWNAIFGKAPLSLAIAADRQKIADMIDSDLSPENLTCDGELSRAQVSRKLKLLTRCAEELISIDFKVTFSEMGV